MNFVTQRVVASALACSLIERQANERGARQAAPWRGGREPMKISKFSGKLAPFFVRRQRQLDVYVLLTYACSVQMQKSRHRVCAGGAFKITYDVSKRKSSDDIVRKKVFLL